MKQVVGLLLAFALGCAGPEVARPVDGPCARPDVWHWAALASQSLQIERFATRPLYDLDAEGHARMLPAVACAGCMAVVSYPAPLRHPGGPPGFERLKGRSFTYDDALVALVRLSEGRREEARQLLSTLAALQDRQGAWGFSFNVRGDGFYNASYIRSGVVAWVLYAMARYTEVTRDRRFLPAMRRAGAWLGGQIDPQSGLIRGGRGRWIDGGARFEPGHIATWASTEHNVDAWFALRLAAHLDPTGPWPNPASLRRAIATRLWIAEQGRYARGLQGTKRDPVIALDAAGTWSALHAIATHQTGRAVHALAFVDEKLGYREAGWDAHRPDNEVTQRLWFVEGSVARGMALSRLGQPVRARRALSQLAQWACTRGVPLAYSSHWYRDFPLTPAAAPTAWFILAAREVVHGEAPFLWRPRLP